MNRIILMFFCSLYFSDLLSSSAVEPIHDSATSVGDLVSILFYPRPQKSYRDDPETIAQAQRKKRAADEKIARSLFIESEERARSEIDVEEGAQRDVSLRPALQERERSVERSIKRQQLLDLQKAEEAARISIKDELSRAGQEIAQDKKAEAERFQKLQGPSVLPEPTPETVVKDLKESVVQESDEIAPLLRKVEVLFEQHKALKDGLGFAGKDIKTKQDLEKLMSNFLDLLKKVDTGKATKAETKLYQEYQEMKLQFFNLIIQVDMLTKLSEAVNQLEKMNIELCGKKIIASIEDELSIKVAQAEKDQPSLKSKKMGNLIMMGAISSCIILIVGLLIEGSVRHQNKFTPYLATMLAGLLFIFFGLIKKYYQEKNELNYDSIKLSDQASIERLIAESNNHSVPKEKQPILQDTSIIINQ